MGTWLKNLDAQDPPRVGPYRLLAVLGSGGMGHVYLGRSPGRRAAAVKVVRPELSGDQVFRTRFQREVEAARTVGGAFTSPVLASDTEGDPPWLATAYIAGPPLNEAVRRHGPLEEPAVRALGAALAEALTAIHEAGLVHRDLKPANVLLAQDGPRVIDFGISRTSDGTTITRSGALVGSPAFMAPEQVASGRRAGPEADVFALGGTLVYAATGARPFDAGTVPAMLARIVHGEPLLDGFPAALLSTVAECLDKDPDRRPSPPDLVERLGGTEPRGWWPPPVREEITARTHEVAALLAAPPERETGPHPPKNDPPVDGAERPKDEAGTESKEPARHSRRGFLAATGAAGAVAAAGAVVWFVRDRVTRDSPSADPSEDRRPLWTYTPHLETTDPQAKGLVVLRTAAHENTVVLGRRRSSPAWTPRPAPADGRCAPSAPPWPPFTFPETRCTRGATPRWATVRSRPTTWATASGGGGSARTSYRRIPRPRLRHRRIDPFHRRNGGRTGPDAIPLVDEIDVRRLRLSAAEQADSLALSSAAARLPRRPDHSGRGMLPRVRRRHGRRDRRGDRQAAVAGTAGPVLRRRRQDVRLAGPRTRVRHPHGPRR
nr:serine/threonine-protein kinase [Actinomadura sp. J1-007]